MKNHPLLGAIVFLLMISVSAPIFANPSLNRPYNSVYEGEYLDRIAFPLGGIGAGMICLEGTGCLSHVSLHHKPDIFNEPLIFSALCIKGETNTARVIEGPVPKWKYFGMPGSGNGSGGKSYGLPRFAESSFLARFPFATIKFKDPNIPLHIELIGWSPFTPGDAHNSSLPVAGLEYRFVNITSKPVKAVFSFNARNFMAVDQGNAGTENIGNGFALIESGGENIPSHLQGGFAAFTDADNARVDCSWFRGGWFDALTMAWKNVEEGKIISQEPVKNSPGASLFVPVNLSPGEEKIVKLMLCWYVPKSNLRHGVDPEQSVASSQLQTVSGTQTTGEKYEPWYAGCYSCLEDIVAYWRRNYDSLRTRSTLFRDCFYNTTLPDEVIEAIASNLTILKSPTILRQKDGRLWCYEGCKDNIGCCHGSCTHVWNYAQAMPHLFPELERTLRETEFFVSQNEKGHQRFRTPLPIRPPAHDFHAAADGQLGGIMKVCRDWRISGDTRWLKTIWPKVKQSLNYCIKEWDPGHKGALFEPHHNTYDVEFWGPDGMCSSFYLGALKAAVLMGQALDDEVTLYAELLKKGRGFVDNELFDGEYYIQKIQWKGLRAGDPTAETDLSYIGEYSPEALELLRKEGPKYQYGIGCLSDGVLGDWMAQVCGVGPILDQDSVTSHLKSVHKYNLKETLVEHANPQRPGFALGDDSGLLLCTWPKGGKLSLPFIYSNEVWTGIEYQVAAHLMMKGRIKEGLDIVKACRDRYDGRVRNPFNEYECGHLVRARSFQLFYAARIDRGSV